MYLLYANIHIIHLIHNRSASYFLIIFINKLIYFVKVSLFFLFLCSRLILQLSNVQFLLYTLVLIIFHWSPFNSSNNSFIHSNLYFHNVTSTNCLRTTVKFTQLTCCYISMKMLLTLYNVILKQKRRGDFLSSKHQTMKISFSPTKEKRTDVYLIHQNVRTRWRICCGFHSIDDRRSQRETKNSKQTILTQTYFCTYKH